MSVVGGDRQSTVGFTVPDADGGSPVTKFEYLLDGGYSDGSLDPSFVVGSGFDGGGLALADQADGKVMVGGSFTAVNVEPRTGSQGWGPPMSGWPWPPSRLSVRWSPVVSQPRPVTPLTLRLVVVGVPCVRLTGT